ncbi:MAG: hypothetical protein L6V84_07565 [Oscillospiraceae bacterium]|nr:MAG: hypothetical protein L6V84_07565 [Oscillospiraceae bacterium]
MGAGFINGLLGAAGGILLVTALPYLPTPSLLSVGANPYGQAGADRRDLFASALAVMLPVSAVSALRYRLAGVDPLPRSLLPLLLPAAAGGTAGRFPAGADIAAPSAPPVRGGHSGIRHPDAVLRGSAHAVYPYACVLRHRRPVRHGSRQCWGCLSCT